MKINKRWAIGPLKSAQEVVDVCAKLKEYGERINYRLAADAIAKHFDRFPNSVLSLVYAGQVGWTIFNTDTLRSYLVDEITTDEFDALLEEEK